MSERWAPVPGYEGLYDVSDRGRVRSLGARGTKPRRILRPDTSKGYERVSLCTEGCVERFRVHHLVLEAFVGSAPTGHETNHKNGVRGDNRVRNLEWVTPSENELHKRHVLGSQVGATNPRSVEVDPGRLLRDHARIGFTNTVAKHGVSHSTMKRVLRGEHWTQR